MSWVNKEFGLPCRCSHITEDKQIGNRIAEQFRHLPAVVIFLAEPSVPIETLAKRAKDDASSGLQTVLIVRNGTSFTCERLLVWTDNSFSAWVQSEYTIVPECINSTKASTIPSPTSAISAGAFPRPDILAAIRTKPFILLAGISGTGKSRMVRQLARGCCPKESPLWDEQKPGNFEMIQVRPNWHDSTELLGYVSRISGTSEYQLTPFVRFLARAWHHLDVPFFLCLDEMNLAPVEQYFAEYLSVIETRKHDAATGEIRTDALVIFPTEIAKSTLDHLFDGVDHGEAQPLIDRFLKAGGIPIPPNLVVMGTVNMDETTFSFSRKVLDRAMSFELSEVDMKGGLDADPDTPQGSIPVAAATPEFVRPLEFYAANQDICDKAIGFLKAVNDELEATPFKIAYRTRDEVLLYCVERLKGGTTLPQALDEAASMKILSRVEGDRNRKDLLEALNKTIREQLTALGDASGDCKVCSKKIDEMLGQLKNGGAYTSFWTR